MDELRALVADDDDEPLPEVGFAPYTRAYMHATGLLFVNHGILPRAGGWDDQDARWWDALVVWLRYYQRARRDVDGDASPRGGGEVDALFQGGDAPNWQEVMHG